MRKMDLHTVAIQKIGNRAFLKVGSDGIEIQNFKISSSMRGGTELEVTLQVESCEVTEFELGAKKEAFQPQNLTAMNDAP